MADPIDAPTAQPPPAPITDIHPHEWAANLDAAPVVSPLDARGRPLPHSEVFEVLAQFTYVPGDQLSVVLSPVPPEHAQAVARRILWALWPGVDGFVADAPAAPVAQPAEGDSALVYAERDRLVSNIATLTEQVVTLRNEADAARASADRRAEDAAEAARAFADGAIGDACAERDAARNAAVNAEAAADKLRVEAREAAKRLKDAEALVRAHEATIAGLRDAAEVTATEYRTAQEAQGRALDAARARAAEADREAVAARAAHVQLAAEYEALKADLEAAHVELAQWKARALDAERGAPVPEGITAEAEAAVTARVAAEVGAEWAARLDAETKRRESAEAAVTTLRGLLDASTPPGPPVSIATPPVVVPAFHTAPPMPLPAPRTGAPFAAPAVPVVAPPAPTTGTAFPPPVALPAVGLPAVGARKPEPTPAPVPVAPPAPVVESAPEVQPEAEVVPPVLDPREVAHIRLVDDFARSRAAEAAPPAPVEAPTTPEDAPPAGPGVIAEGLAPLPLPVAQPAPAGGTDAELYALGMTPESVLKAVAAEAASARFVHEAVRLLVERVRPQRPDYDFDAMLSDLKTIHGMTGPDGRSVVPAISRVPLAALRERVASVVAAKPDIGVRLPPE